MRKKTSLHFQILARTRVGLGAVCVAIGMLTACSSAPVSSGSSDAPDDVGGTDGTDATDDTDDTVPGSVPVATAASLAFTDTDFVGDEFGGEVVVGAATDETTLDTYVLYWGADATTKSHATPIATLAKTGSDLTYDVAAGTVPPTSTTHILVFTANATGEMATGIATELTDTVDIEFPTQGNNGMLAATPVSTTSIKLDWSAAVDVETASADLQYRVMAAQAASVQPLPHQAVLDGDPLTDWQPNMTTYTVTDLDENTEYRFGVIVRDAVDNQSAYAMATSYPLDETPPLAPDPVLSIGTVTTFSVVVNWTAAMDRSGDLEYQVVYASAASSVDTVEHVTASLSQGGVSAATVAMAWTAYMDTLTATVSGLNAGTTYAFNVMVKDARGNIQMYSVKEQATTASPVYVFKYPDLNSNTVYGNMTTDNNSSPLGTARERADALCAATASNTFGGYCTAMANVHALISIDASDAIAQFTSNYGLSNNAPLKGLKPDLSSGIVVTDVAGTWSSALAGTFLNNISDGTGHAGSYLTGSDATAGADIINNCTNFTNTGSTDTSTFGYGSWVIGTNAPRMFYYDGGGTISCNNPNALLCLCWQ